MKKRNLYFITCSVCSLVLAPTIHAQTAGQAQGGANVDQFRVAVFSALEYDDNIRRTSENEESDVREALGINFTYGYNARSLDVAMGYELSHENHQDDSFNSNTRLAGNARAELFSSTKRYSWLVQHDESVTNTNTKNLDTPDNLNQRSIFTTGPNVSLMLSPVDSLIASLRYVDVRYEDDQARDSQRNQVSLNWNHRLNPTDSFGVNTSYVDVDEDSDAPSYTQERIGLIYTSQIRYGNYSIEAGTTSLDRDISGADSVDGGYYRFNFNTSVNGNTLGVAINREITDSSIGLSQNFSFGSGFSNGDVNFDEADIITRTRYQVFYQRQNADGKLGFDISLSYDDQDYETELSDQETQAASVGVSYALSQNLTSSLSLRHEINEYIEEPLLGEDKNTFFNFNVDHSLGEKWTLTYSARYSERENDVDASRDFESAQFEFRVNYQLR